MRIYGKTDTGKVRSNNQDSFRECRIGELSLCVVCDGMGGAAGGSTASNTACDEFIKKAAELISEDNNSSKFEEHLREAVRCANSKVYEMSRAIRELTGMGTTLCAILSDGKKIWAVSVGDSRIYMFDDGKIFQISHDHSYVQILVDSGAITKEESLVHPNKNIITRAVGTSEYIECDSFVMDFTADGFLLCSDGLSNFVSDDELNSIFRQYSENEEEMAQSFIDSANKAGGGDNITAFVIIKD